jgi:hypothetical protein
MNNFIASGWDFIMPREKKDKSWRVQCLLLWYLANTKQKRVERGKVQEPMSSTCTKTNLISSTTAV